MKLQKHMRIRALISAIAATMAVQVLSAANTYYVDANAGDDAYDGSSATRGAGDVGPKKTLAAAMSLVTANNGDVVYAAPGFYTNGVATVSSAKYRVSVPKKTTLVASGDADETFIVGEEAPADAADRNSYGNGAGAMRCVYLNDNAVVQGFTITGGRTPATGTVAEKAGAGIGGSTSAYAIDCIISNNVAVYRGGAIYYGPMSVRCYFAYNRAIGAIGDSICGGGTAYNCVCGPCYGYHFYSTTSYNCTFVGQSSRSGNTYNAIVLNSDGGSDKMYNCFYVLGMASGTTANETCRKVTVAELALDENYRPTWTSVAIDAGNMNYYTNRFSNIPDQMPYDFAKGPRLAGTIDVGACEFDWRTLPAESGIETSITSVEGGEKLRVWRNFTSAKLVKGFKYGDTTVMFDDVEGGVWETVVEGRAVANQLVPVYETSQTDWYVNPDPVKGDDGNPGYHSDCPKRTLAAAMALAKSGDVVHAAAGVYAEGVMAPVGVTSNRVTVKAGVGLVADYGPDVTAIEGFIPDIAGKGNATSVRCVGLLSGAYLKGFTLRNGSTAITENGYGDTGGGVNGGTAIDCVISNCYAVRGGAAGSSVLIRCRATQCGYVTGQGANNAAPGMNGGSAYDTYVADATLAISRGVNSYFADLVWSTSASSPIRLYNSYAARDNGYLVMTNSILGGAAKSTSIVGEGSRQNTSVTLESYRPKAGSVAIDAGNSDYYVYPSAFAHEQGTDVKGGQRIYNGRIDIGCGEYDWRGEFGAKLNGKGRASVAAASANVTTNALDGIVLSSGDAVDVDYAVADASKTGICSFRVLVSGEGSATVTFGGETLVPDGTGRYVYTNVAGANRISISFEGEGSAVVSDFSGPQMGMRIIFR